MLQIAKQPNTIEKAIEDISKEIISLEEKKSRLINMSKDFKFLELMNGCEEISDDEYINSVIWTKNGVNYFELNKKTNKLWCDYDYVWNIFEKEFKMGYTEIKLFISRAMDKYFNFKGLLPWKDMI